MKEGLEKTKLRRRKNKRSRRKFENFKLECFPEFRENLEKQETRYLEALEGSEDLLKGLIMFRGANKPN